MPQSRLRTRRVSAVLAALAFPSVALAADTTAPYPSKLICVVIGFSASSTVDTSARVIANINAD